ncbi:DUF4870 domain-containing protein [Chloroflexota bacterium]
MSEIEGEVLEAGEVTGSGPGDMADPFESEETRAVTTTAYLGLTGDEVKWAALAHGSILVTLLLGIVSGGLVAIVGVAIPAAIWYLNRDKSDYVADQARQATVFQLAGFVALLGLIVGGALILVVGWGVSAALTVILIGLILIPVMIVVTVLWVAALVALPIAMVVYGCYAAVETHNGRPFRYRWVADMIDRHEAQA